MLRTYTELFHKLHGERSAHGEGDAQIPLADAQRCFDAVGSRQKVFKVFTRDEGGYHHCQEDNTMIGIAYMWNWLEDVLQPMR